jgi:hypothetical protein
MENADYQLEQFCVGFKFHWSLASVHDKYTVVITFILSPLTGRPVTKLHNVIAETLRSSGKVMLVQLFLESLTLKDGTNGCTKTSVNSYQHRLRIIPQQLNLCLHRGESMKSQYNKLSLFSPGL